MAPAHQPRDARDQDIALRRSCRSNADDQARGRDNAIIGAKDRSPQPADAGDEVVLRMCAKTAHMVLLAISSPS